MWRLGTDEGLNKAMIYVTLALSLIFLAMP